MGLLISLRSEILKLKRTATIIVCLIAAAFSPLMRFLEDIDIGRRETGAPWIEHLLIQQEVLNFAYLPLFIILISTLWLQTEFKDKTWKQVLTSPQKKFHIFIAKFIVLHLLILLFLILYNIFLALAGIGTELMHPQLYNAGFNLRKLIVTYAQNYFLIFGISAIQFLFALRFKNFIAPVALGFVLWLLAPMMVFEMKWTNIEVYPYAYSMLSVLPKYKADVVNYQWYSIAYAVVFLSVAFIDFSRRKVKT
jgi:hypothetical protein